MKRLSVTIVLLLGAALPGRSQEKAPASQAALAATALGNPAVVLSPSSFDDARPERPIVYYLSFGTEVILPRTFWTFDARQDAQQAKLAGVDVAIQLREGSFHLASPGPAPRLTEQGLGLEAVPLGGKALLALPRAFASQGQGKVFYRSGMAQEGQVAGTAVRLYDEDLDGRFVQGKDSLSVGDTGPMSIFAPLGRVLPTAGAAWEIQSLAPDGSSMDLAPFAGPTGTLGFKPIEGVQCRLALASEDGACSFGVLAGEPLTVPAGSYRVLYGYLFRPKAKHVVGLVLPTENLPIVVGKGEQVTVTLGDLARRDLPWGEGLLTLDVRHLLEMDSLAIQEAYLAGDYAKAQAMLDELLAAVKTGPNYQASKAALENLRQDLAVENSPQGAALRDAAAKAAAAIKDAKPDEAKALVAQAEKTLAALPAQWQGAWAAIAHKTRLGILAAAAAGTDRPGVRLMQKTNKDTSEEVVATIDWQDPQGKGWGHVRTYEGVLVAPRAGDYELTLESLGVAVMTLDGKAVINHPLHLPAERSVTVTLEAGPHPFKLDVQAYVYGYTHSNKPHMVRLFWTPPGQPRTIVPDWALFHQPPAPKAPTGP